MATRKIEIRVNDKNIKVNEGESLANIAANIANSIKVWSGPEHYVYGVTLCKSRDGNYMQIFNWRVLNGVHMPLYFNIEMSEQMILLGMIDREFNSGYRTVDYYLFNSNEAAIRFMSFIKTNNPKYINVFITKHFM